MRNAYQNRTKKPPIWAETLLRALLAQRSRDAIAGDLLEEYRESVLPSVGAFRARIWYIRQVLSFLDVVGLVKVIGKIPTTLLWGTAAWLLGYGLFVAAPYRTGISVSTVLLLFIGIVLIIFGATAVRTMTAGWSLLRIGVLGFICFAVATAVVTSADVFRPALLMGTFLIIITAMGFQGANRTGQVRSGIITAAGAGIGITALIVLTVSLLDLPHPPLASVLVLPAASAILGAIGASFGKRFGRSDGDVLILPMNFI
jgi:hypothetical protein